MGSRSAWRVLRLRRRAHQDRGAILGAVVAEGIAGSVSSAGALTAACRAAPARQGTAQAVYRHLTGCIDPDDVQVAEVVTLGILLIIASAAFGSHAMWHFIAMVTGRAGTQRGRS